MDPDHRKERKDSSSALALDGVGVRFGTRWILRRFSLSVHTGEKVALVGPSGSGKSTVLRCLLGLVVPEEGEVRVEGCTLNERSVWGLRRSLAYVPQEPDLGSGTADAVLRNPFLFKANAGLRGNLERLPALLDRFRLPATVLQQNTSALSGGEKQRVALVLAILLARPIILLDEASSALDEENRRIVSAFFLDAPEITVLSISHRPEDRVFCDRVVNMGEEWSP